MVGEKYYCEGGNSSKRQYPGARLIRPVQCHDGAQVEFRRAILEGTQEGGAPCFGHERFTLKEDDAGSRLLGVCKDAREIQIVCQEHVAMLTGIVTDFAVLGGDASNR